MVLQRQRPHTPLHITVLRRTDDRPLADETTAIIAGRNPQCPKRLLTAPATFRIPWFVGTRRHKSVWRQLAGRNPNSEPRHVEVDKHHRADKAANRVCCFIGPTWLRIRRLLKLSNNLNIFAGQRAKRIGGGAVQRLSSSSIRRSATVRATTWIFLVGLKREAVHKTVLLEL